MSPRHHPEDLKQLVRFVHSLLDCTQEEMASKASLDPSTVGRYVAGRGTPSRKNLEAILATVHLPMLFAEACLLPAFASAREVRAFFSAEALEDLDAAGEALDRALAGIGRSAVTAFLAATRPHAEEPSRLPGDRPSAEDRLAVPALMRRLEACTAEARRELVENLPEFQTWSLAEWFCHRSADAASDRADQSLELARLAFRIARRVPGDKRWRVRVEGYVLPFVANALRVANRMKGAERASARGMKLWEAGAAADPGLLAEWRLLDLQISLRRDQRRFPKALEALDRALALAPPEVMARLLLKKASTLEQMGEAGRALEVLREAAPLIDDQREPRLLSILSFNRVTCLCHLRRYEEAEEMLPEVRDLALERDLDLLRIRWLSGRVWAGLGREVEAQAAWDEVRREFSDRKMACDYALVTLDLAGLLLEQGRHAEVRNLAGEIVGILEANGIHREAQTALELFHAAARKS